MVALVINRKKIMESKMNKCITCANRFYAEKEEGTAPSGRGPICLITKLNITYPVGKCTHYEVVK